MFNAEQLFAQLESYLAKSDKEKLLSDIEKAGGMKYIEPVNNSVIVRFVPSHDTKEIMYNLSSVITEGVLALNGDIKQLNRISRGNSYKESLIRTGHTVLWGSIDEEVEELPLYGLKNPNRLSYSC